MTSKDVFDRLTKLFEALIETNTDIKQLCEDAKEYGMPVNPLRKLARLRAQGKLDDEAATQKALRAVAVELGLVEFSQLDLFERKVAEVISFKPN